MSAQQHPFLGASVLAGLGAAGSRINGGRKPSSDEIAIELIDEDANQPRHDFGDLKSLEASIRLVGVLQPVGVREGEGGRYTLVYGARRLRAAKLAEKTMIPARVVRGDQVGLKAQVIENQHREALANSEVAAVINALAASGMTVEAIGEITNLPRYRIFHYRSIKDLDFIFNEIVDKVDVRVIYELVGAWDKLSSNRRDALAQFIYDALTTRGAPGRLSLNQLRLFLRSLSPVKRGEKSFVYVIRRIIKGGGKPEVKVGRSNNPDRRMSELSRIGQLEKGLLVSFEKEYDTDQACQIEAEVHDMLAPRSLGNEWFEVEDFAAIQAIKVAERIIIRAEVMAGKGKPFGHKAIPKSGIDIETAGQSHIVTVLSEHDDHLAGEAGQGEDQRFPEAPEDGASVDRPPVKMPTKTRRIVSEAFRHLIEEFVPASKRKAAWALVQGEFDLRMPEKGRP